MLSNTGLIFKIIANKASTIRYIIKFTSSKVKKNILIDAMFLLIFDALL